MKKKNNERIEMVFILDRSGSMACVEDETIQGYNDFLMKEMKKSDEVYVTTVLFDDNYELLYSGVNIKEVKKLTKKEYYARGCTALMDAIGKTISDMNRKVSHNSRVVVIIMTDGLENASVEYNRSQIRNLIKQYNKWEFVFLGANIDSFAEGSSLGIRKEKIANFKQNDASIKNVFKCAKMFCDNVDFNLQEEIDK